ncbi:hypothetical protein [Zavarzinella formosa]|uniref:hypothetical protein n=1 Tax=Zavarzinella formosa TaxID=360055 RepID=UPI0002D8D026|nr:hypothetical protein [Zavarzinella formosa]
MFNSDQRDHMRYLASLPTDAKCKCGWNLKGDCSNCPPEVETQKAGEPEPGHLFGDLAQPNTNALKG